jgi:hypothetical protein
MQDVDTELKVVEDEAGKAIATNELSLPDPASPEEAEKILKANEKKKKNVPSL